MYLHNEIKNSKEQLIAEVEYYPEFAMSASAVVYTLKEAINGVKEFYTTNGTCFLSKDETVLFIYDSIVVLKFDLKNKKVYHWNKPDSSRYISTFKETDDHYHIEFYGGEPYESKEIIPKKDLKFEEGFGQVSKGILPSSHPPIIKPIKKEKQRK